MPSTPYDAKGLLLAAIEDPDPVLFCEPKRLYRSVRQEVPDEYYTVPLGAARVVREGETVTLISWGAPVRDCEEALEGRGETEVELIDLRSLCPLDLETVLASVRKTHRAIVVHEAPRTGGFGAEIAAAIQENCMLHLEAPVLRVSGADAIMPLGKLEKQYLPDAARINAAIAEVLAF